MYVVSVLVPPYVLQTLLSLFAYASLRPNVCLCTAMAGVFSFLAGTRVHDLRDMTFMERL